MRKLIFPTLIATCLLAGTTTPLAASEYSPESSPEVPSDPLPALAAMCYTASPGSVTIAGFSCADEVAMLVASVAASEPPVPLVLAMSVDEARFVGGVRPAMRSGWVRRRSARLLKGRFGMHGEPVEVKRGSGPKGVRLQAK